jgi:hypothetical protein
MQLEESFKNPWESHPNIGGIEYYVNERVHTHSVMLDVACSM